MTINEMLKNFDNSEKIKCPYCATYVNFEFKDMQTAQPEESINIQEAKSPCCYKRVIVERQIKNNLKKRPFGAGHSLEKNIGSRNIIYPRQKIICIDERIPSEIRNDLNNANSIVDITPDAAISLARRALERILKKYIVKKNYKLVDLIAAAKEYLPPVIFKNLDACREYGNFGAHLNEDYVTKEPLTITENEAQFTIDSVNNLAEYWFIQKVRDDEMTEQAKVKKSRAASKNF